MTNCQLTKNEFVLLYAIKRDGLRSFRSLRDELGLSLGYISQTVKRFSAFGYISESGLTDAGREALQPYAPCISGRNRDEGRRCPYHADAEFPSHPVSVPLRTGGGIRAPARREDHGIRIDLLTGTRLNTGRAYGPFLFISQYTFDGAVVADLYIPAFQVGEESLGNVRGVVRDGKDPVSPLSLDRAAVVSHELHHLLLVVAVYRAVQEFGIRHDVTHKFLGITGIREVAPAFSRDVDLLACLFRLFQNSDRRASVRGGAGSHQACRAGADDNDMLFIFLFFEIIIHAHSIN